MSITTLRHFFFTRIQQSWQYYDIPSEHCSFKHYLNWKKFTTIIDYIYVMKKLQCDLKAFKKKLIATYFALELPYLLFQQHNLHISVQDPLF